MSDDSKIEWTDATWNPVTGCTEVSPGCDHCYAKTFAERWRGTPGHHFEQGFDVVLRPERLDQPLRWKKPRRIFVNSMSDLFHDEIPDDFIAQVFAAMQLANQHTFQVLTKRHGRMRSLLKSDHFTVLLDDHRERIQPGCGDFAWPLPNVWLGVSVENQAWADIRIPALLDTPAAIRFLSCEPLLGQVLLQREWLVPQARLCGYSGKTTEDHAAVATVLRAAVRQMGAGSAFVDWVIVGGESGHGARPMRTDWARSLRDQCTTAGVSFHFKQWGEWVPEDQSPEDAVIPARFLRDEDTGGIRLGKTKAGRKLDGRTWDEFPPETPLSSRRRADAGTPPRKSGSSTRASATAAGQGNPA